MHTKAIVFWMGIGAARTPHLLWVEGATFLVPRLLRRSPEVVSQISDLMKVKMALIIWNHCINRHSNFLAPHRVTQ